MPKPNIEPFNLRKWSIILNNPDLMTLSESIMDPEGILKEFEEDAIGEKPFYECHGFKYYAIDVNEHITRFTPLKELTGEDAKAWMEYYAIIIENTNDPSIGNYFLESHVRILNSSDDLHIENTALMERLEAFCTKKYGKQSYPAIKYVMYFDRRFKDNRDVPHIYTVYDSALGFFADCANLHEHHSEDWAKLVEGLDDESLNLFALEYYWRFTKNKKPDDPAEYYWKLYNVVLMSTVSNIIACAAEEYNIEILTNALKATVPNMWDYRFRSERALTEATIEEVIDEVGVNVNDISDMFVGCNEPDDDDEQ